MTGMHIRKENEMMFIAEWWCCKAWMDVKHWPYPFEMSPDHLLLETGCLRICNLYVITSSLS